MLKRFVNESHCGKSVPSLEECVPEVCCSKFRPKFGGIFVISVLVFMQFDEILSIFDQSYLILSLSSRLCLSVLRYCLFHSYQLEGVVLLRGTVFMQSL